MLNLPSMSDTVFLDVPFSTIVAPGNPCPVSSLTIPVITSCALMPDALNRNVPALWQKMDEAMAASPMDRCDNNDDIPEPTAMASLLIIFLWLYTLA